MADINLSIGGEDLEALKKLLQGLNKEIQKLKKFSIIGDDEATKAKALVAEQKKISNQIKRQEIANQRLEQQQEKINQKQRESVGIIGRLESEQKKLRSAVKSAQTEMEKKGAQRQLERVTKELQKAKGTTASWGKALGSFQFKFNALGNIAANVVQNLTSKMTQFVKESIRAAAEAEGIQRAFSQLNKAGLLDELRESVRGTVSDVRLMQAAVKANNFKIPLEQLGTFFQFAQQRAVQTGEGVDYLVESIVNGIARKSLPILDNLGLSATEVREEFAKTGDMAQAVGNIISRSMGDSSRGTLTMAEQLDQATANAENLKIEIGRVAAMGVTKLLPTLNKMVDFLEQAFLTQSMIRRQVLDANTLYRIEQDRAEVLVIANSLRENGYKLQKDQTFEQAASLSLLKEYRTNLADTNKEDADKLELLRNQILELEYMAGIRSRTSAVDEAEEQEKIAKAEEKRIEGLQKKFQLRKDDAAFQKAAAESQQEFQDKSIEDSEAEIERILQSQESFVSAEEEKTEVLEEETEKRKKAAKDEEDYKRQVLMDTVKLVKDLTGNLSSLYQQQKENELSAVGDNAEKRLEIEKEYAQKQQNIAVANSLINGAEAITQVWSKHADNPIVAGILTALAATSVGIQVAAIKKQKFAKGGVVGGKPHSQGGTEIEAERGEYVVNKKSTSKWSGLIEGVNEDNQVKILSEIDKYRSMGKIKTDPYTKKMYELLRDQEAYGETPHFYIIKKGTTKTLLRK